MCGNRTWTSAEDEIVRDNYPMHGAKWDGWEQLLPGRTTVAIQARAYKLGTGAYRKAMAAANATAKRKTWHSWDRRELDALLEHYPLHGHAWSGWADALPGRTPLAIKRKAEHLQLETTAGPLTEGQRRYVLKATLASARAIGAKPHQVAEAMCDLREQFEKGGWE